MSEATKREKFIRNDIHANKRTLLWRAGLVHESKVPVQQFILHDGSPGSPEFFLVKEGRWIMALFLQYLAELAGKQEFEMTDEYRALARVFFTDEQCRDATTNPDTTHTSLKTILIDFVDPVVEVIPLK